MNPKTIFDLVDGAISVVRAAINTGESIHVYCGKCGSGGPHNFEEITARFLGQLSSVGKKTYKCSACNALIDVEGKVV